MSQLPSRATSRDIQSRTKEQAQSTDVKMREPATTTRTIPVSGIVTKIGPHACRGNSALPAATTLGTSTRRRRRRRRPLFFLSLTAFLLLAACVPHLFFFVWAPRPATKLTKTKRPRLGIDRGSRFMVFSTLCGKRRWHAVSADAGGGGRARLARTRSLDDYSQEDFLCTFFNSFFFTRHVICRLIKSGCHS